MKIAILLIAFLFPFSALAEPDSTIHPPNYELAPSMNSAMGTTAWNLLHKDNTISIAKECESIKSVLTNYIGVNNYCKTDDDCMLARDLNYFSCDVIINKNAKEKVTKKIAAYDELCVTGNNVGCVTPTSEPKCMFGTCRYNSPHNVGAGDIIK